MCITLVNEKRVPLSAFPHLLINPDIRSAGLGDGGIALSPDVNSLYANTAKTVYNPQKIAVGVSYSPWLRNLIGDMAIYNVSAYKSNGKSAFGLALTYFKEGEVLTTNDLNVSTGKISPNEFNINGNDTKKGIIDSLFCASMPNVIHKKLPSQR